MYMYMYMNICVYVCVYTHTDTFFTYIYILPKKTMSYPVRFCEEEMRVFQHIATY